MDNVLIVACVFPPEPVVSARLSDDIYNAIKRKGVKVKVLHPRATRPNGYHFGSDICIGPDEIISDSYTCPKSSLFGRFLESISFGRATYKYIEQHHIDIGIIYANTWPLFGQYYMAKAAKKFGVPYYIHIQDIYPESYCYKMPKFIGRVFLKILLPIDKYVLRNATAIIAISPSMIKFLSQTRKVDLVKFTLVRNWQDDKAFIETYKPSDGVKEKCQVMYLGSINPTANVKLIIDACSKLDNSKFKLSVIGNGPDKDECVELAKQVGLDVTFETVGPEEVSRTQRLADILVLCLKKGVAQTATPSKLTAYMLTGRPIIASVDEDSDCANIIREARCGLVVEPDNDELLRDAIKSLAGKSIEERNLMGKLAFNYAVKHLSKESNLGILTELISRTND